VAWDRSLGGVLIHAAYEIERIGSDVRPPETTVVVAAISRKCPRIVLYGGVGDSGIAIVRASGTLSWLSPRDREHPFYVTVETEALPPDASTFYHGVFDLEQGETMFMASDGALSAAHSDPYQYGSVMAQAMILPEPKKSFGTFVHFEMPGEIDDRTIVAVHRRALRSGDEER
jgi:hypothetical protein